MGCLENTDPRPQTLKTHLKNTDPENSEVDLHYRGDWGNCGPGVIMAPLSLRAPKFLLPFSMTNIFGMYQA